MPANLAAMPEYLIHGHRVTQDNQRRWHCKCQDFERRVVRYGERFCEHVALAIERAIEEGRINLPAQ
jgi:predicted nucleic acid-binding Zn finger protein